MSTDTATKPAEKQKGVIVDDPEIATLAKCDKMLAEVDVETAARIAGYLAQKYARLQFAAMTRPATSAGEYAVRGMVG